MKRRWGFGRSSLSSANSKLKSCMATMFVGRASMATIMIIRASSASVSFVVLHVHSYLSLFAICNMGLTLMKHELACQV